MNELSENGLLKLLKITLVLLINGYMLVGVIIQHLQDVFLIMLHGLIENFMKNTIIQKLQLNNLENTF